MDLFPGEKIVKEFKPAIVNISLSEKGAQYLLDKDYKKKACFGALTTASLSGIVVTNKRILKKSTFWNPFQWRTLNLSYDEILNFEKAERVLISGKTIGLKPQWSYKYAINISLKNGKVIQVRFDNNRDRDDVYTLIRRYRKV